MNFSTQQAENQKLDDEALTGRHTDIERGRQWGKTNKNTDLDLLHSTAMAVYSYDSESSIKG